MSYIRREKASPSAGRSCGAGRDGDPGGAVRGEAQPVGHHVHGKIALEELDRPSAPALEFSRTPLWSHGVPPTGENRTLLKQESIAVVQAVDAIVGSSRG